MSKINEEHLKNVCLLGAGSLTCSYLGMGGQGFECLKRTQFQGIIDRRRAERQIRAMGDNCSGPPEFQPIQETIH